MNTNTHGYLVDFLDGTRAFIDGIPDNCQHVWDGPGYHHISTIGYSFCGYIPDTCQGYGDFEKLDTELRKEGKYISGGSVSCSKCGMPYEPNFFYE